MGLSAAQLKQGLDAVAKLEPGFARAIKVAGYPEPRIRSRGYGTLMRTIVGQQVSVAAAASMWRKFEAHAGEELDPQRVLDADFDTLRACGLSRQKQGYMRSLCELVVTGQLDFDGLPADDEEAIAQLTAIKGIGRWSAEIYLLFAEGRTDIWPQATLRCKPACTNCSIWTPAQPRKPPAKWPKSGVRTAARRRSSPGTAITIRRFDPKAPPQWGGVGVGVRHSL